MVTASASGSGFPLRSQPRNSAATASPHPVASIGRRGVSTAQTPSGPGCDHRDAVVGQIEAGDEDDAGAALAQPGRRRARFRQGGDLPAGQPFELEAVRRHDVGHRDRMVAVEFRDAGADIPAGPDIAHDRVAGEECPRVRLLDPADDVEQHRAGFGAAQIAGQHRVAVPEDPQFGDALEQARDLLRRDRGAAPFPVSGVVREGDRVERPRLASQALQRKERRGIADIAAGHPGLDRQYGRHVSAPLAYQPSGGSMRSNTCFMSRKMIAPLTMKSAIPAECIAPSSQA